MSNDYQDWLKETGNEDTDENRGWYECPEDERADYIEEHSEWWSNY